MTQQLQFDFTAPVIPDGYRRCGVGYVGSAVPCGKIRPERQFTKPTNKVCVCCYKKNHRRRPEVKAKIRLYMKQYNRGVRVRDYKSDDLNEVPKNKFSDDDTGFVYFISDGTHIKIGKANDPCQRVRELQTANPFVLEMLGVTQGGHKLEFRLHDLLAEFRLQGEWFVMNDHVMSVIRPYLFESMLEAA